MLSSYPRLLPYPICSAWKLSRAFFRGSAGSQDGLLRTCKEVILLLQMTHAPRLFRYYPHRKVARHLCFQSSVSCSS